MPRAKKDQQKGQILKKTTVLCPSRKYYSIIRVKEGGGVIVLENSEKRVMQCTGVSQ